MIKFDVAMLFKISILLYSSNPNKLIGVDFSAWTTAFLAAEQPASSSQFLVAVSGYGHHRVTGDFGLLPQAHAGLHCILACIGVVCLHPGLGKTRGEARQRTRRRRGEDADPVPHFKHRHRGEGRFARGVRTTARLFGKSSSSRGV